MRVINEEGKRPIHLWTDDVDDGAMQQLKNVASLPFIHPHGIAAMPDVHWGIGATVGSVIATRGAIIPAAVGVDIGCGMMAARLNVRADQLPDSLQRMHDNIEKAVEPGPGGQHQVPLITMPKFPSTKLAVMVEHLMKLDRVEGQLGTLGGGNHFVEICLDEEKRVWIMLHSGSRGIGNKIGTHYISEAKKLMERFFVTLPDKDLAYLPDGTTTHDDYVEAVSWAQDYARLNRETMMVQTLDKVCRELHKLTVSIEETAINCHHNYVEKENHYGHNAWVTRKGAIRARLGDLGIIPGSMGARSFIVRGKGNPASYASCSHGAGRKHGRKAARERFTVEDLRRQTEGVVCRKDEGVLDELPSAYKDIDEVMANQADLVEIVHTLKQVVCVKGN